MLEDRGYTIDRANVGSDEDMHWFIHAKSKIKGKTLKLGREETGQDGNH